MALTISLLAELFACRATIFIGPSRRYFFDDLIPGDRRRMTGHEGYKLKWLRTGGKVRNLHTIDPHLTHPCIHDKPRSIWRGIKGGDTVGKAASMNGLANDHASRRESRLKRYLCEFGVMDL